MKNKSIMIQGTSSSVGKSFICAALCRIFTQDGYNVNPFKSQNMALNSYVTIEGLEIGRAQAMQAEACGKIPSVSMNPILLKPATDRKSQVIISGRVYDNMDATEYFAFKPQLKSKISGIYDELCTQSDIVVIEGAGSPAEINLKHEDFVNMGMAKIAKAPVILVGDIDRGGVFASLAGTMMLLDEDEKRLVKGVIINKFRGSYELLKPGIEMLEDIIKVPVLGVIPYFKHNLEDEDSVSDWINYSIEKKGDIDIAVISLPHMSNFTDFNSLKLHDDVNLRFVRLEDQLGKPDVIIIPGTKTTIPDLKELIDAGMNEKLHNAVNEGSILFGICGGYQMLGLEIRDTLRIESQLGSIEGLGFIDAITEVKEGKITALSEGIAEGFDCCVKGYEIHMGETYFKEKKEPMIRLTKRNGYPYAEFDGVMNLDKGILGTYFHGIFDNSEFTTKFLNIVRKKKGMDVKKAYPMDYWQYKDEQYDKLADIVRTSIDMDRVYSILNGGIHA